VRLARNDRRRGIRMRLAVLVVCWLSAFGLLAGCTSARNLLGPRESACFRVLPEARAAVGEGASFGGVRYLPPRDLVTAVERARRHGLKVPPALVEVARRATCLVGYRGHFHLSGVKKGWAPLRGPYLYAIVVTNQRSGVVVATVLLHRLPFRLADISPF